MIIIFLSYAILAMVSSPKEPKLLCVTWSAHKMRHYNNSAAAHKAELRSAAVEVAHRAQLGSAAVEVVA